MSIQAFCSCANRAQFAICLGHGKPCIVVDPVFPFRLDLVALWPAPQVMQLQRA